MMIYRELASRGLMTRQDLTGLLGSPSKAAWRIRRYLGEGLLERVHRDLYAVISIESGEPVPTPFQIALALAPGAYLSHQSALDAHNHSDPGQAVYVSAPGRCSSLSYRSRVYHVMKAPERPLVLVDGKLRVARREQVFIDSLDARDLCLASLALDPGISPDMLLYVLESYGKGRLYQAAGYVLEQLGASLPDWFFTLCRERSSRAKVYLSEDRRAVVYDKDWKVYAPRIFHFSSDRQPESIMSPSSSLWDVDSDSLR